MQKKRIVLLMMVAALIMSSMSLVAFADEIIDVDAECNPTISYAYDGEELEGVKVELFKLADVDAKGDVELSESFSDYRISLKGVSGEEGWNDVASTCAGYVVADELKAVDSSDTNKSGEAAFNKVEPGLYLVVTEDTAIEGYDYHYDPYIITLPTRTEKGTLDYNPTLSAKADGSKSISLMRTSGEDEELIFDDVTPAVPNTTEHIIVAHWNDNSKDSKRPETLKAEIYQDGALKESVVLDKGNNWTYKWNVENAEEASALTVVGRDIPENYTISSTKDGNVFTLTNTYDAAEDVLETVGATNAGTPSVAQMNWPIPVLALLGLALMVGGVLAKR